VFYDDPNRPNRYLLARELTSRPDATDVEVTHRAWQIPHLLFFCLYYDYLFSEFLQSWKHDVSDKQNEFFFCFCYCLSEWHLFLTGGSNCVVESLHCWKSESNHAFAIRTKKYPIATVSQTTRRASAGRAGGPGLWQNHPNYMVHMHPSLSLRPLTTAHESQIIR
jgi:hypothetical protein